MNTHYTTLAGVHALIRGFESCTLPHADWNHTAHLTVGIWYMIRFDEADAADRMIRGIQRYNHSLGIRTTPTGGYHETITLFWLSLARNFAARRPGARPLETVNGFVERYAAHKGLLLEHYTRDLLFSPVARYCWVEPDLKPLRAA